MTTTSDETTESTGAASAEPKPRPRLQTRYRQEIVPALQEQFHYTNIMTVPGLTKVVVNMGVGEAARDSKLIEGAVRDLTTITRQKAQSARRGKGVAERR